jgi:hypothetical protein
MQLSIGIEPLTLYILSFEEEEEEEEEEDSWKSLAY